MDPSLAQKKRARHRLVGAVCLCLLAAIVVPLVLESEPRPTHDLPLELAAAPGSPGARAGAHPDGRSAQADASGPSASGAIAARDAAAGAAGGSAPGSSEASAESLSSVKTVTPAASAPPAQPAVPSRPAPAARGEAARGEAARGEAGKGGAAKGSRTEAAPAAKHDGSRKDAGKEAARESAREPVKEAARAPAKPDAAPPPASVREGGRDGGPDVIARLIERTDGHTKTAPAAAAPQGRKFLVQIGAYSNVQSARNMSDRAVQAGLRPYQETVKTAQGDWIRVRVGPFPTRQDAERAQQDLKRAGVTAAIIAL